MSLAFRAAVFAAGMAAVIAPIQAANDPNSQPNPYQTMVVPSAAVHEFQSPIRA